jgi:hypothetical protein
VAKAQARTRWDESIESGLRRVLTVQFPSAKGGIIGCLGGCDSAVADGDYKGRFRPALRGTRTAESSGDSEGTHREVRTCPVERA